MTARQVLIALLWVWVVGAITLYLAQFADYFAFVPSLVAG